MRKLLLGALVAVSLAACSKPAAPAVETPAVETAAVEAPAPVVAPKSVYINAEGVAAGGYDVVSFFDGKPAAGVADFTSTVDGATYRFASAESKAKFDAEPAKFTPQYGGFCAYGASVGKKFQTDPTTGTVVNGKLYFNKNPDVAKLWNKDQPGAITKADAAWPTIQNDETAG